MNRFIHKLEKHALDGDEIIKITKRKDVGYVYYDDLKENENIFKKPIMAVLYSVKDQNIGHWVLIGKRAGGIYYFDPLGNAPETDLELTGENPGKLRAILKGKKVKYNHYAFQNQKNNTCGRHVGLRAKMWEVADDEYKRFIVGHHNLDNDSVVSLLTFCVTHKGSGKDLLGGSMEMIGHPMYSAHIWYP